MTPLDYHCRVCRKPGVAYYDPSCPITYIESWRSVLTCDRCYKFRDSYQRTKRDIERACVVLLSVRQTVRDYKLKREAEGKIRERLVALTKRISHLCSDYYRLEDVWENEMAEVLMDNPDGCNKSINAFRSRYAALVDQQPAFA